MHRADFAIALYTVWQCKGLKKVRERSKKDTTFFFRFLPKRRRPKLFPRTAGCPWIQQRSALLVLLSETRTNTSSTSSQILSMHLHKIVAACTLLFSCLGVAASPLVVDRAQEFEGSGGFSESELHRRTDQDSIPESMDQTPPTRKYTEMMEVGWSIRRQFDPVRRKFWWRYSVIVTETESGDPVSSFFLNQNGDVKHGHVTRSGWDKPTYPRRLVPFAFPFDAGLESLALESISRRDGLKRCEWIVGAMHLWHYRYHVPLDITTLRKAIETEEKKVLPLRLFHKSSCHWGYDHSADKEIRDYT
ncbi:hypothetical protein EV361DRAFT_557036 [Lentinula raphanica]|uniref:Uncharacterized protein n=1 Tax=Lentinula raphanica TaxID=153919 RepID=A0AA38UGM5_9AGAR|nr:hypothetical protein F5880DRAFT_1608962 [Lentinula raphanica]KAJ3841107.1 hypothetical protein F5878DRAFT_33653 [Lentinula raphanica]KAJ3966589.1 hypothetical protein EV361DRAFT_557036 [Lentinula raphanica]